MGNRFEISGDFNHGFLIGKDGLKFGIEKRIDEDIWFTSSKELIDVPINGYSREYEEIDTFAVFEDLMKLIIGRFYLSGDSTGLYGVLPKDFVNMDKKTITWHSDTGRENTLTLRLSGKDILVSLYKNPRFALQSTQLDDTVRVRIRTSGSEYGYYYQEFEKFYRELSHVASRYEQKPQEIGVQKQKTSQTP